MVHTNRIVSINRFELFIYLVIYYSMLYVNDVRRDIWTCEPSTQDADYSENSYVIHVISKILQPIFAHNSPPTITWNVMLAKHLRDKGFRVFLSNEIPLMDKEFLNL